MKLKSDVLLTETDGSIIAVATATNNRFNGMIRMNVTAGFVAKLLQQETTEDEIVQKMLEQYEVSEDVARTNIRKVVEGFRKIGFLTE